MSACGKGSYGRLGLGDSNNHPTPKKLAFDSMTTIKKVVSSKGSDGHTLALTQEGEVYSWGDGKYCYDPGCHSHENHGILKFSGISGKVMEF